MPRKAPPDTTDLEDIERLVALRAEVEDMMVKAVRKARKRGWSWMKIGPALGVSYQSAHEKYASKVGK